MVDTVKRRKVTIRTLQKKMREGEAITQLAAYDYRTAVVSDRLGMDILCVSDTGGMILFGHQSTTRVSFDEVMMMSKASTGAHNMGLGWLICHIGVFMFQKNKQLKMQEDLCMKQMLKL